MDVGIGLPNTLHGVAGPDLLAWARRSEAAGFTFLGTIGRIVYDNHEELIALAAAAGATERIGLMSTVLVAPPRQPVLLAKQAATLSAVSGGRFTLGLGLGGRDDDWVALGVEPSKKGRALEHVVAVCRSVWAGQAPEGADGVVGPTPTDIRLALSGFSDPAFRRAGRLADTFIAGPMPPEAVRHAFDIVKAAAAEAGRAVPTLVACRYAAIGPEAAAEGEANLGAYYASAGADVVQAVQGSLLRTADEVKMTAEVLKAVGADSICLWPSAHSLEQVDSLAAAAGL